MTWQGNTMETVLSRMIVPPAQKRMCVASYPNYLQREPEISIKTLRAAGI